MNEQELTFEQQQEIDAIAEKAFTPGSNANKARYDLYAWIEAHTAKAVLDGQIDEVAHMPHSRRPDLHSMSNDPIPQVLECNCYKGRRLKYLKTQRNALDKREDL